MSSAHSAGTGSKSVINNTKNEPVVGRNSHLGAYDSVREHS